MRGTYPAFPVVVEGGASSGLGAELHHGMDARTWLAGKALAGILANPAANTLGLEQAADAAVEHVDALLARLEKAEGSR